MKKIFIYISLMLLQGIVLAQPMPNRDYINQSKYWFYRNRLINEFCKVGPNQGESIPFQSINYSDNNYNNPDANRLANTGDGGVQKLGHYIGVLASEIRLLKNSSQDASKTIAELFYALFAAQRLDQAAETVSFCYDVTHENTSVKYAYPQYDNTTCHNQNPSFNGFMLRDDRNPNSNSDIYKHFNNMTGITNITSGYGYNVSPYYPSTKQIAAATQPNAFASTLNDVSHDQLLNLFIGLRLTQVLLDGNETYTFQNTPYNLKQYAQNIATIVMGYMATGSDLNNQANCDYVLNAMGLTSKNSAWYFPWLQGMTGNLLCSGSSPFANPATGKYPWLFDNPNLKQPASIENSPGASFPFWISEGYAELGNKLTGQSYLTTALAKESWRQLGTTMGPLIYKQNDNWKILSLAAMTDAWNNVNIQCEIPIYYPCFGSKCLFGTNSHGRCKLNVKVPTVNICSINLPCVNKDAIIYDQCWRSRYEVLPLIYNVINNKTGFSSLLPGGATTSAYRDFFDSNIDNAPCRGPYFYSSTNKAGNNWNSWNMFITPDVGNTTIRQNGKFGDNGYPNADAGEYNGLDYMLMYNLYNIMNGKNNYYVNYDNNLSLTGPKLIGGPEYYNARSYKDLNGARVNGVVNATGVVVSNTGYLNIRAGSSINLKPPFLAQGKMDATIYQPTDNAAWEMTVCSDGTPVNNGTPNGHRTTNRRDNFTDDYTASANSTNQNNLGDSYPNPATNTTKISYTIGNEEAAELFITDATGSKVVSLVKKDLHSVGDFVVDYSTTELSAGIYYYTLKTSSYSKTKKLIIIK